MKRMMIVLTMSALIGEAVFARGTMDSGGGRIAGGSAAGGIGDTVQMTGTVVEVEGRVVLENADGAWSLSAPGFPRSGAEVPWNSEVTVTGIQVDHDDALCECDIDVDGHIFVTAATAGGTAYDFDGGRGADGRGYGRNAGVSGGSRFGGRVSAGGPGRSGGNTRGGRMDGGNRPMDGSGRFDGSDDDWAPGMGRRFAR